MPIFYKGSCGPWIDFDDYTIDSNTIYIVKKHGINLDGFASYTNKICNRYFSLGFQI